jgi:hypothetical protein
LILEISETFLKLFSQISRKIQFLVFFFLLEFNLFFREKTN